MDRVNEATHPPDQSILQFWSQSLKRFGHETTLSPRELEIMGVMIREITQSEDIALELSISTHTVNNHLKNIFEKTKSRSKTDVLAKFFAFATRLLLKSYFPISFSRPYIIQVLSQDLSYGQKLGSLLAQKGARVHASSLFKQEAYLPGSQFDLVIKPINFNKDMDAEELLPVRKSHRLCIQLEKNLTVSESETSGDHLVKPELLSLGCIGIISQLESIEKTSEKILHSIGVFCPNSDQELPTSQTKKASIGPLHLEVSSLGTHGVFVGFDDIEKGKNQLQPGQVVDLKFLLPNQSQESIEVVALVAWRRLSPEIGKKSGFGLWFLSFQKQDDYFTYQAFIQKYQAHWALPAATDQFEELDLNAKNISLPAGA
jgi:DNA-binding CsgD family transcriptional regulator